MNSVDKAFETQLNNIQTQTGKSLDELYTLIRMSGLTKHGEIRDLLKRDLGLGYGDANTLARFFLQSDGQPAAQATGPTTDELVSALYTGAKADLRSTYDELMAAIATFGPFEIAPKKGYVSLRRKKQFATIGPATKARIEVGLNMKHLTATTRLIEMAAGSMCQYKVNVTKVEDVDEELVAWIKQAYDSAG